MREAVLAKIRELRQRPVSQAELDTAKTVLATSWAFTNETYLDQVGSIGFYEMIDTYKFAFDYLDLVRTITPEQVQEVARKYLDPDAYAGVTVRPQQSGEQEAMIPWPLG
ncbi:MAG: insulinase family protein [Armatimonadetes bacterium]|nr:insulinase family protein [Armatimonadota bacterium]